MPAAWRLATSTFSRRRARSALLVACVALCAALVTMIACAIASLNKGLEQRINETIGAADLRLTHSGRAPFDANVLAKVDTWPEVKLATGRAIDSIALKNPTTAAETRVLAYGIIPDRENTLRPLDLTAGRLVQADNEIVLEQRAAETLGTTVGDTLHLLKFGDSAIYTVVGIARPPPLSAFLGTQSPVYLTAATLSKAVDRQPILHEIDIVLKENELADVVVSRHRAELDDRLVLQPTVRVTAAFSNNRKSSQIGLVIASLFAFLASSFIIATGMTTGVTERTRELAVLRCIGAEKKQLAFAQLLVGFFTGSLGAIIGVPLGLLASYILILRYPDQLPAGFAWTWMGVTGAIVGAVGAGVIGASWSAWNAARVSPLMGLAARAQPPKRRTIVLLFVAALCLISIQATIVLCRPIIGERFFWFYAPIGVPSLITGYFLLGVPLTLALSKLLAPPLGAIAALPRSLLARSLAQNPFRVGFTASSLMVGVAMLVAIWTNGRAVLERWLNQMTFPDAFVTGLSMKGSLPDRIRNVPGVNDACAITLHTLDTSAFGVKGLTSYKTTFIAFEPEPFFKMMHLQWVQGDPATAIAELNKGGSVLVAREFLVTRNVGVGSTLTLTDPAVPSRTRDFKVVGVVASPGLEVASKFFEVGENYVDQAVSSVFGNRADLVGTFKNDAVNMVQLDLDDSKDSEDVMTAVRRLPNSGILTYGTAVWLKKRITDMIGGSMRITSLIAIGAMLIASFGVANIIVASVQARAFQFGVLRALGAQRGLLGRLVLAEAALIALAGGTLGMMLGLQAAWGGQNVTASAIGIELTLDPPIVPMLAAVAVVLTITLLAAAPTAWSLMRKPPRALLASAGAA